MSSSASSNSSSSSPKSTGRSQNSTADKIAKLTLASSLAGAVFTAAYESTIGRARAIRELEAKATAGSTGPPDVGAQHVGSAGTTNLRPDATKFYRHNTALLSAAAALNSGLVAFAFFSLREHVVSPVLAGARSSSGADGEVDQTLTWSAMRTHHLEDSALTGALLGGAFNAWKKGPKGIFPGAFTASLACTVLQLVVNELDVQRVRYVSSHQSRSASTSSASSLIASQSQGQSSVLQTTDSFSRSASPSTGDASVTDTDAAEPGLGLGERILAFIGITKVDDAEYLRRLKAKRERHLARIRELEALEEARRASEAEAQEGLEPDSNGRSAR